MLAEAALVKPVEGTLARRDVGGCAEAFSECPIQSNSRGIQSDAQLEGSCVQGCFLLKSE